MRNHRLRAAAGNKGKQQFIAVSFGQSPYIHIYPWSSATGFGTKISDPSTLPTGSGSKVAFTKNGNAVAIAHTDSPYVTAYPFSATGFGTKYANPSTLPPQRGYDVAFSPNQNYIAVAHQNSPYVTAYPWSTSGFGTKYANPSELPTVICEGVAFNAQNNVLAVTTPSAEPYVIAYEFSSSGFGSKYADPDPAVVFGSIGNVRFSPSGNAIAFGAAFGPIYAYAWSSGFGTKYDSPSGSFSFGYSIAFSPSGQYVASTSTTTPYVNVWPWSDSTGFGSVYSNPATLPTGAGWLTAFSPNNDAIAIVHNNSPYITAYPWSGSGFGTKYSNPATLPTDNAFGVDFTEI